MNRRPLPSGRRPRARAGGLHLLEQLLGFGQRCGDDPLRHFEELEEQRLGDRVVDVRPHLPDLDEVGPAHDAELLGEVRCFDADFGDELADRSLTVPEDLEDADPLPGARGS